MSMLRHEDEPISTGSDLPPARVREPMGISADIVVGPRGGRRIPVRVLWRPVGTGLFRQVVQGTGAVALYPFVEWHNGNNRMRYWTPEEWAAGKELP